MDDLPGNMTGKTKEMLHMHTAGVVKGQQPIQRRRHADHPHYDVAQARTGDAQL